MMRPQPPSQTLGMTIRARRIELGLTQEELAGRVGGRLRQSEISRLERDVVTLPRRPRLEAIAAALDLPVGELLARSGWVGANEIAARNDARSAGAVAAPAQTDPSRWRPRAPAHESDEPAVERLRRAQSRAAELIDSYRALERRSLECMSSQVQQSKESGKLIAGR